MDAMVLLRGEALSVEGLSRPTLEQRGLVSPTDPRAIRTCELARGELAVDLLCDFEGLAARPRWTAVECVRHVLGPAVEQQHDDPRGFFIFPFGERAIGRYDRVIADHATVGFWAPRVATYPSDEIAGFKRFEAAYGDADAATRRALLGLPPRK